MQRIPILAPGASLFATIQADASDRVTTPVQDELMEKIPAAGARDVPIDISWRQVVDSFPGQRSAGILELGLSLGGRAAHNVQPEMALLDQGLAPAPHRALTLVPAGGERADSDREGPAETSGGGANLYPITCDNDVVQFRHRVREAAVTAGLRLIDQTKLVTAARALARNALEHGGGGLGEVVLLDTVGRSGVRLIVEDEGPGIPDIDQALTEGYSQAKGLGMGLPGTSRLVDSFEVWSKVGVGSV